MSVQAYVAAHFEIADAVKAGRMDLPTVEALIVCAPRDVAAAAADFLSMYEVNPDAAFTRLDCYRDPEAAKRCDDPACRANGAHG
jgi:hypothetical protein